MVQSRPVRKSIPKPDIDGYAGVFGSHLEFTIWNLDFLAAILYLPIENRTFLSGFQMLNARWLPKTIDIYVRFSNAICKPTYFPPLEIRTCPDFRSPLYRCLWWCFWQPSGIYYLKSGLFGSHLVFANWKQILKKSGFLMFLVFERSVFMKYLRQIQALQGTVGIWIAN